MGRNPYSPIYHGTRPPTLAEYAMAKKQLEADLKEFIIGVDQADGDDETTVLVVDRETLASIYWNTIPPEKKRKIKIGDKHTPFPRTNNK